MQKSGYQNHDHPFHSSRLTVCRSEGASNQPWNQRLTPYWKNVAGGCHLNRDIAALISEAGFACLDLQTMSPPGPPTRDL